MRTKQASRPSSTRAQQRATASAQAARTMHTRIAAALIIMAAFFVLLQYVVYPNGRMNWSYQVVMLCVVVVAAAARALLISSSPPAENDSPSPRAPVFFPPLVFLTAAFMYAYTLRLGFYSDDYALTGNLIPVHSAWDAFNLHPFHSLYRPLHVAIWWEEYHLWGFTPIGYHAVSLLLHASNAVLVYVLGLRIMHRPLGALLAALLFAVHPIHTEAVTWVSCQNDLQAAFFALLSLLCLDLFLQSTQRVPRVLAFVGTCLCYVLAALTKESPLALPAVAVLWILFRSGRKAWKQLLLVGGVLGAIAVVYLVVRVLSLRTFGGYHAATDFWNTWFPSTFLRQLYLVFFPLNRALLERLPKALSLWFLLAALLLMGGFLLLCMLRLRHLPGRRLGIYAGYAFVMTLPVWIFTMTTPALEYSRFAYLPTIGWMWLIGDVLTSGRASSRRWSVLPVVVLAAAGILCLWNFLPWRIAQILVRQTVQSAVNVAQTTPRGEREPIFFMQDLPDTILGAQVFRNGFSHAVTYALGRRALVQTVAPAGDIPIEVLNLSKLQPGEYIYRWDYTSHAFVLTRSGTAEEQGGQS